MNINLSQAQSTGWTDGNTIYLTIPSPSELLVESPGGGDSSYACPVCNVQFQTRSQLMGHTRKHMKDKLFQCKLCEQNFPTHKELKSHMGGKTENDAYDIRCGICNRTFPSQPCLTHHLNCHKEAGSAPVIIDNPAEERSEYQIQIQVQDPLGLDSLDPSMQTQTLTVDPSQIDLSQIQNVVVIPAGSSSPTSIANLIVTATQQAQVQVHQVQHHPNPEAPPSQEGAPPTKKRKRNTQPKGASQNSLQNNSNVEYLAASHRYSCSLCNKTFKNSQHVQRHLRIHTGEKPFACTVCSQSFSLNHNLQRHMRTHTGEKPHKCPICTKEFAEGHNLKRHMISAHDGPTPYVCPICNRKFAENSILKKHQNKAHKSSSSNPSASSSNEDNCITPN